MPQLSSALLDRSTRPRRAAALAVVAAVTTSTVTFGLAPAGAAEIDETITDLRVSHTSATIGDSVRITAGWSIPDDAQPGDTFSVQLPPEITPVQTEFDLLDGETVVGSAGVQGGIVTVTLGDYVAEQPLDVHGTFTFNVVVNDTAVPGQPIVIDWGRTVSITPYAPRPERYDSKTGTFNADGAVTWSVEVDGGRSDVVLTDTPLDHRIRCDTLRVELADVTTDANGAATYTNWQRITGQVGVDCSSSGFSVDFGDAVGPNQHAFVVYFADLSQPYDADGSLTLDNQWSVSSAEGTVGDTERTDLVSASGTGEGTGDASIGDRVWFDTDGNGLQGSGEAGVPGVTAILRDAAGQEVARTVTDAQGYYLFPRSPRTPRTASSSPTCRTATSSPAGSPATCCSTRTWTRPRASPRRRPSVRGLAICARWTPASSRRRMSPRLSRPRSRLRS